MKETEEEIRAMGTDPLAADDILEHFYRPTNPVGQAPIGRRPQRALPAGAKEKPTHYKVVCISLYNEDVAHLESLVAELKRRGHSKANKSQVIRAALGQIDLAKVPRGY